MAKIMLVEDDKNLREIYSIRLVAEGYEVAVAGDGEEALAMAVEAKPDLVVSDVMMPKISGFDMLDILRSTPETKEIKAIMLTALSSDDQRARGEALGADKYLVKSQVGIEDVVNAVHEVLGDQPTAPADQSPAPNSANTPAAETPAAPVSTSPPETPSTPPTSPAETAPVAAPAPAEPVPETSALVAPTFAETPAPTEPPTADPDSSALQSLSSQMDQLLAED